MPEDPETPNEPDPTVIVVSALKVGKNCTFKVKEGCAVRILTRIIEDPPPPPPT
jgi:hypothetical protein